MSNKDLFLELGDIIQMNAPSNSLINNHTYFIDYIDKNMMILIDDTSLDKKTINIDSDGKLDDESIESIAILSKSDKKGYARQNNLIPDNWVSIHIGGEIPAIITAQITDLEEDMIPFFKKFSESFFCYILGSTIVLFFLLKIIIQNNGCQKFLK